MAYQYQPFPKTEGLPAIITPKLAAGPKLQTGTLLRPQEEGPSTKDAITGYLLGSVLGGVAQPLVEKLGQRAQRREGLPNWLQLTERDPLVPQEGVFSSINTDGSLKTKEAIEKELPQHKAENQYYQSLTVPQRDKWIQQKQKADLLYPRYRPSSRLTPFGKIATGLLSIAPAAALDRDSVDTYIKGLSTAQTTEGKRQALELESQLTRLQKRADIQGEAGGKPTAETFHGVVEVSPGNFQQVNWQGQYTDDGRAYIYSQGLTKEVIHQGKRVRVPVDRYPAGHPKEYQPVPKGELYANSAVTGELTPGKLDTTSEKLYYNYDRKPGQPQFAQAYIVQEMVEDPVTKVQRPTQRVYLDLGGTEGRKLLSQVPGRWGEPPPQSFYKPRDPEDIGATTFVDTIQPILDAQTTLATAAPLVHRINILAAGSNKNPQAFSDKSTGMLEWARTWDRDLDVLYDHWGGNTGYNKALRETFRDDGFSYELKLSLDAYNVAQQQGSASQIQMAEDGFKRALQKWSQNADKQDAYLFGSQYVGDSDPESALRLTSILGLDAEGIDTLTSDRMVLVSTQLQLAYMAAAAAGQTSRTLSDKDLANFLAVLGFGTSAKAEDAGRLATLFIADRFNDLDNNEYTVRFTTPGPRGQDELERLLRTQLEIEPDLIQRARGTGTKAEQAQQQVKDEVARMTGMKGNLFIDYNPDGTLKWRTATDRLFQNPALKHFLGPADAPNNSGWFDHFGIPYYKGQNTMRLGVGRNKASAADTSQDDDSYGINKATN